MSFRQKLWNGQVQARVTNDQVQDQETASSMPTSCSNSVCYGKWLLSISATEDSDQNLLQ